jgi:hypothetical protein
MNTRKLLNGKHVKEYPHAVTITVYTKCPEKWVLIDTETGQRYTAIGEPTTVPVLGKISANPLNCGYGTWIKSNNKDTADLIYTANTLD